MIRSLIGSIGGGNTHDFDQIFFKGEHSCDHKSVHWFVVPKYLFSNVAQVRASYQRGELAVSQPFKPLSDHIYFY